jgi:hypothetical protein
MAETGETYQQALSALLREEIEQIEHGAHDPAEPASSSASSTASRRSGSRSRMAVHVEPTASGRQGRGMAAEVQPASPGQRCSRPDGDIESTTSARRSAQKDVGASVELFVATYFGWPITLAVYEASEPVGCPIILRVPSSRHWTPELRTAAPILKYRRAARGEFWQ